MSEAVTGPGEPISGMLPGLKGAANLDIRAAFASKPTLTKSTILPGAFALDLPARKPGVEIGSKKPLPMAKPQEKAAVEPQSKVTSSKTSKFDLPKEPWEASYKLKSTPRASRKGVEVGSKRPAPPPEVKPQEKAPAENEAVSDQGWEFAVPVEEVTIPHGFKGKFLVDAFNTAVTQVMDALVGKISDKDRGFLARQREVTKEPPMRAFAENIENFATRCLDPRVKEESDTAVVLTADPKPMDPKKKAELKKQQEKDRSNPIVYHYGKDEVACTEVARAVETKAVAVESLTKGRKALEERGALIDEKMKELEKPDVGDDILRACYKLLGDSGDVIQQKLKDLETGAAIIALKSQLAEEKKSLPEQLASFDKAIEWANRPERGKYIPTNEIRTYYDTKEGEKMFVTEPVNLYEQEMKGVHGESLGTAIRHGAICDWGHLLTNLREMKTALQDEDVRKSLLANWEQMAGKKKIDPRQKKTIEATMALFASHDTLAAAVRERTMVLRQQMLPVLWRHIRAHAGELKNGAEFALIHESALNASKDKFEGGFPHVERNQILDMESAFGLFEGSEIIFDPKVTQPFIDADGSVKMPPLKGLSSIIARPIFFNVSVQGHKEKDLQLQYQINSQAFAKLEKVKNEKVKSMSPAQRNMINEVFHKCQQMNISRESSYELAGEHIASLAVLLGLAMGVNCFSGKDRTGYVTFMVMVSLLKKQIDKLQADGVIDEKLAEKLKKEFASRGFDPEGVATQISKMNTDEDSLKVSRLLPPGVKTLSGLVDRAVSGIKGFYRDWKKGKAAAAG
jgi:hypothetical protein